MKFEFRLKGRDWFGIFITGYLIYVSQFVVNLNFMPAKGVKPESLQLESFGITFGYMLLCGIALMLLAIQILKRFAENTYLESSPFSYTGTTWQFFLMYIKNVLLSLVTLGIYFPWAIRNFVRHIIGNTEYRQNRLSFEGNASTLFLIGIFAVFIPMIIVATAATMTFHDFETNPYVSIPVTMFMYLLLIPYVYFMIKWNSNIRYAAYAIQLNTSAIPSILKILQEVVLSIVTLGIYFPAAHARLFRYFAEKTEVYKDDGTSYSLKTNLDVLEAWKITWVQCLLSIVTLGIYGAWAYSKVAALYVNSLSIEKS